MPQPPLGGVPPRSRAIPGSRPLGPRNSDFGTLTPARPKAGEGSCGGELRNPSGPRAPEKAAWSTLCLREGRVPPGPRTAAGAGACDWEPASALPHLLSSFPRLRNPYPANLSPRLFLCPVGSPQSLRLAVRTVRPARSPLKLTDDSAASTLRGKNPHRTAAARRTHLPRGLCYPRLDPHDPGAS